MKKFFMLLTLSVLLIMPTTVFAAQKTKLPVTMRHRASYGDDVYSVTLNKVEVKRITAYTYSSSVKIEFDIDYSDPSGHGRYYIEINCYDADGEFLETVSLSSSSMSAYVPIDTATVEFTVEKPASRHDSYIYRNPFVTMYAADGRTQIVADTAVEANKQVGWFTAPPATVYSANGKATAIEPSDIESYKANGWFTSPPVTIYSADGASLAIEQSDVEEYKADGWFTSPPVTMYAADGRTQIVPSEDVEANKQAGWFTALPVTMYSADGRTQLVSSDEIKAHKKVGWFTAPPITMYAADGRTLLVDPTDVEANKAVGWYEYPVITMYAEDGRTLAVAKTDIEAYKAVGWYDYPVYTTQKTKLPVIMQHQPYSGNPYTVTLNKFEVKSITANSDGTLRVSFDIDYTDSYGYGYMYVKINCYDASGVFLKKVGFNKYSDYIDVPFATATIEFTVENPASGHNTYIYSNPVNVYTPDGRVITVTDLQVPAYEAVGWSKAVTMYAPDSRTIVISPFEISAYEAVGWYTYEGVLFNEFKNNYYNVLKPSGDYNSVFEAVNTLLPYVSGTKYEQSVYGVRDEAMNLWRSQSGRPMGVINYTLGKNSIGTPEVTINFRNISYKKIIAYKVKFDCYNVFGGYEETYYSYYYDDDADLAVAGTVRTTWTLYGADSVNTVKNIRVTEAVFEDGTKWYGY